MWFGLNILWVVLMIRSSMARAKEPVPRADGWTVASGIHTPLGRGRAAADAAAKAPDTFPEEWVR